MGYTMNPNPNRPIKFNRIHHVKYHSRSSCSWCLCMDADVT